MSDETLSSCGCCEGVHARTPASVENRPGLPVLAYRAGTQASFKAAMHAAIAGQPKLRKLTTREDDDPAIALLDAWATVLDVLSFYQERIANEGFLRTATEGRSILELARSIGYELRPGVAASTQLAFTLETAPGSPASAVIPVGTKAQSIPKQDETPQIFETIEEIEAHPEWNAIEAKSREHVLPKLGATHIYLKGTATNLKPGDALLIIGDERLHNPGNENWDFRRVKVIEEFPDPDPEKAYTAITLDHGLGSSLPFKHPAQKNPKVYALRQRASLFGYNALPWNALPVALRIGEKSPANGKVIPGPFANRQNTWADAHFAPGTKTINLDAVYSQIAAGSWIVLATPRYTEVYRITVAVEETKADYLLAGKTTQLTIAGENIEKFSPRNAAVFGQNELLDWAAKPTIEPVAGDSVMLDAPLTGLTLGRLVAVSGTDSATGKKVTEVMRLKAVEGAKLIFTEALAGKYLPASVRINANVAHATHGETKSEVLGSADGSQAFQKFSLKQKPLTFVPAPTPSGGETTLKVRVSDLLWDEARSFFGLTPSDRSYTVRLADDATATVQFGDGIHGARPPSGIENVKAEYRVGTGLAGHVEAGQISLLMTRPLGVKEVINPRAPSGGEDPEKLDNAVRNAPLTVLTFERIVSLRDVEDFTRAFGGIGKAQATLLWSGEQRLVHLTVAAADGGPIAAGSDLYNNLLAAIDAARHPQQPVRVDSFQARTFSVHVKILVDRRHIAADVLAAVKNALVDAFSFRKRAFGQAVTESEVVAVMQRVEGVVAVDLDALFFTGNTPEPNPRLPSHIAHWEAGKITPAELLTIDAEAIALTQMTT